MRGGRMLIIVGVVMVLGVIIVAGVLLMRRPPPPEELPEVTPGEEPTIYVEPEGMQNIVVARQDILRSTRVVSEMVEMVTWPEGSVPEGALTEIENAVDRIARVDIIQGMPIMEGTLTERPGDLGAVGSNVALQIPPGKVAYALPVARYSSVAWALQPGDHVDVIISLLLVDLDEEFQTALPNDASCVQPSVEEGCEGGVMGRLEVLPNGWVVNLTPGGQQKQNPRLVTQLTVQDAVVLRVGEWPIEEEPLVSLPVEEEGLLEPLEPAEPVVEEELEPPERKKIEPLTLIVTPQDAMVLKYVEELGADIDLVLRSAGDTNRVGTQSVTLQYIFERFNIELPSKLPYGVTPPVESLPGNLGDLTPGEIEALREGENWYGAEE